MGVQRLGVAGRLLCQGRWRGRVASIPYSTYSTYSKEPGDCGGSAAWRTRGAVPPQQSPRCPQWEVGIPHCGQL